MKPINKKKRGLIYVQDASLIIFAILFLGIFIGQIILNGGVSGFMAKIRSTIQIPVANTD